jgi:GR25 family glycosyltransferase involved in LPS biosynthesis
MSDEEWVDRRSAVPFHAQPIRPPEVGCMLSHLKVWRIIRERKLGVALVLEDDGAFQVHPSSPIP